MDEGELIYLKMDYNTNDWHPRGVGIVGIRHAVSLRGMGEFMVHSLSSLFVERLQGIIR